MSEREQIQAEIFAEIASLRDDVARLKHALDANAAEIRRLRLDLEAALRGERAAPSIETGSQTVH